MRFRHLDFLLNILLLFFYFVFLFIAFIFRIVIWLIFFDFIFIWDIIILPFVTIFYILTNTILLFDIYLLLFIFGLFVFFFHLFHLLSLLSSEGRCWDTVRILLIWYIIVLPSFHPFPPFFHVKCSVVLSILLSRLVINLIFAATHVLEDLEQDHDEGCQA